jgi:hypothetical protein
MVSRLMGNGSDEEKDSLYLSREQQRPANEIKLPGQS